MVFSRTQQIFLSIVPHVTGLLSIAGSLYIVIDVLRKGKVKTHGRLLLGMSLSDIIVSVFYALSTWPIPRETEGTYFAIGNTASCRAQGFFIQLGIITPFYNGFLALHYLLITKYNMSSDFIERNVELYLHLSAILFGIITSVAGAVLLLYNSANLWCWIAPDPVNKKSNHWEIFRWAFFYVPLWFMILFATVAMTALYLTVLMQEKKMDHYSVNGSGSRKRKNSRTVANQSMFYVGAFYITWVPATINRVMEQAQGKSFFALSLLMALLTPAQGFFNFLVYVRPKYLRYRSEKKKSQRQAKRSVNSRPRCLDDGKADLNINKRTDQVDQAVSFDTGEAKIEIE